MHPRASGRAATYGDLARDRQLLRVVPTPNVSTDAPEDAQNVIAEQPTPPDAWMVAGHSVAKLDAHGFVTGAHRFTSDQVLPRLLHGKVLRPPAFAASLANVDTSAAEAMAGVTVVHAGDFVGVAAPDELTATQALDAIRVRWRTTLQVSQPELFDYLKANPVELEGRRGPQVVVEGSVREGLAAAFELPESRVGVIVSDTGAGYGGKHAGDAAIEAARLA